jgi:sulfide:quinone oxidoreductase
VLIAGGGPAALEALLALHKLAPGRVSPVLIAPDPSFRHRPLSVAEPFKLATPRRLDLEQVALRHGATYLHDSLAEVVPAERKIRTGGGRELGYDALLIALGARAGTTIPGALAFWDVSDHGAFAELLDRLTGGEVRHLAFVIPTELTWPLGLYELALLTAAQVASQGLEDVKMTFVTPELRPLRMLGDRASEVATRLLVESKIDVRAATQPVRFAGGELLVEGGDGHSIECDAVVGLPSPAVASIPGIPQNRDGFIPVDRYCGVLGMEDVYAAGDVTTFPIKQGGIATQQADAAASAIAEGAGAPVDAEPFAPVLRGALLTTAGPRYMRRILDDRARGEAARSVLWWPPAKIAGRYLAPYLMHEAGYRGDAAELTDLTAPPADDPLDSGTGRDDVFGAALVSADLDAGSGDYAAAMRWLEVAEDLELYLPPEYERKRASWQESAGA